MASMRQLFPFYDPHEKTKRNFIKENIRNAKGCKKCIADKKRQFTNKNDTKTEIENSRKPRSVTFKSETEVGVPVIKCNMKILNRTITPTSYHKSNGTPKTNAKTKQSTVDGKCQSCGQPVTVEKMKQCTGSDEKLDTCSDNNPKDTPVVRNKHHILSHEREDYSKKKIPNKSLDLSLYKKGEVPRYLQERLARLMKEEEERKEHENLAKKLGLNDPKCPPAHMFMPSDQVEEELAAFCKLYESLIRELNTMPITRDSLRIRNRKTEIDKELKELDEKISLYRNGNVFIKIPE